jgi:hypothetical protein
MFFSSTKKEALAIHEGAVEKYEISYHNMIAECEKLGKLKESAVVQLAYIEDIINSIANTPKEFDKYMSQIKAERTVFKETKEYAHEAYKSAIKSGICIALTFGTASTGTAINALSGAVATNATKAALGLSGGALAAGGGGMAAGKALLALAGPLGWGISAATTFASLAVFTHKNKKVSKEAIEAAKNITVYRAALDETSKKIEYLAKEIAPLLDNIKNQIEKCKKHKNSSYINLTADEQMLLGTLVNNALSLSSLINKTVD